jgi:hypothetical protein
MSNYTKLAIVLLRVFGIVMLGYAAPMLLLAILGMVSGSSSASGGTTGLGGMALAWGAYAVGGIVVLILSRPLARLATRGLEDPAPTPGSSV